jgi:predicted unusual protein kinase regulating ubiquinone biosynthesis (AarF/ABC1/UbiB family)
VPGAEPALSLVARARRAQRISTTVGRAWLGLRTQRWIERNLAPRDMPARWHAQHRRNAEELYAAAVELRGLILKAAQWLGARPDRCRARASRCWRSSRTACPPGPIP